MWTQIKRAWSALARLGQECRTPETVAILAVTAILAVRHFLGEHLQSPPLANLWSALTALWPAFARGVVQRQVIAITLQLALPLLVIYTVHRRRPRDFGLGLGDWRFWGAICAVVFLVQFVVVAFFLSKDPTYAHRYPSLPEARDGGLTFWVWESSRLLYMLSWEFLFRGYLLFALLGRLGWSALAVQTTPFVLMHIVSHKPASEVFFTIFSGMASGALALESRSVWPVVLLHGVGAVLLDIFIVFG